MHSSPIQHRIDNSHKRFTEGKQAYRTFIILKSEPSQGEINGIFLSLRKRRLSTKHIK